MKSAFSVVGFAVSCGSLQALHGPNADTFVPKRDGGKHPFGGSCVSCSVKSGCENKDEHSADRDSYPHPSPPRRPNALTILRLYAIQSIAGLHHL
jgi:hypothetical protein